VRYDEAAALRRNSAVSTAAVDTDPQSNAPLHGEGADPAQLRPVVIGKRLTDLSKIAVRSSFRCAGTTYPLAWFLGFGLYYRALAATLPRAVAERSC
jgi:hypothetical protein